MKKYIVLIVALLLLTGSAYAQAEREYEIGDTCHTMMDKWFGDEGVLMSENPEMDKLISDYMNLRLESLNNETPVNAEYLSDLVSENETARRGAIQKMKMGMAINITDAATHFTYKTWEDGTIEVREWIFYDYDDLDVEGVGLNVSGFGSTHYITIENINGKYMIVSDEYDETAITGMNTLSDERKQEEEEPVCEDEEDEATLQGPTFYSAYNVDAAVAYSDKYALNYNTAYANFASYGGDCANFASQCINAGGMPQVVGSKYGTNGWFYKASNNRSATWTGANQLCTWMSENRGIQIIGAKKSEVYKGSPVFFDWEKDGKWNHATFCVGANAEGSPIINGHTANQYHAKVDMSQRYCVVQLTPNNSGNTVDVGSNMKYFYGPNYSGLCAESTGYVVFGYENNTSIYSFVRQSNGAFTIQSSCYGTYLTAESDGYVRLRPYTGAANQQWYFYNSSYSDKTYVKSAAYSNGYLVPSVTNGNRIGSYLKIGALPTDLETQYEYSFNLSDWGPYVYEISANTEYGNGLTEIKWASRHRDGYYMAFHGAFNYTLTIYKDGAVYQTHTVAAPGTTSNSVVAELPVGNYTAIAKANIYGMELTTPTVEFTVGNYVVETDAYIEAEWTSNAGSCEYLAHVHGLNRDAKFIRAVYEPSGLLISCKVVDIEGNTGGVEESLVAAPGQIIKLMLIDDMAHVTPLAESVSFTVPDVIVFPMPQ